MRLSQLDDVLFPVEEHPVFVVVPGRIGERRLAAPGKKAIVISPANASSGLSAAIIGW